MPYLCGFADFVNQKENSKIYILLNEHIQVILYKKLLDIALFKQATLDPEVDARILKNKDILQAAKEMAPTESIKNSLKAVAENQSKFKALTVAKFAASTILTAGTYLGLTKFRHN